MNLTRHGATSAILSDVIDTFSGLEGIGIDKQLDSQRELFELRVVKFLFCSTSRPGGN